MDTVSVFPGIENVEFICGKAEDVLPPLMHKLYKNEVEQSEGKLPVVAVVDPPRAGLRK